MSFQSPLQLEQQYRALREDLQRTATARWHLARIAAFLETSSPDQPELESYLLELIPITADLATRMDPVGGPPEPLAALADTLAGAEGPSGIEEERERAVRHLRRAAARLYAYAGAVGPALALLQDRPADEGADLSLDAPQPTAPKARLAAAASQVPASQAEALRRLAEDWDRAVPDLAVPVVERNRTEAGQQGRGRLLALHVDLYDIEAPADDLTVEGRWQGADADTKTPLVPTLSAARHWLQGRDDRLADCRVAGRVRLGEGRVETTGESAQLALAVQFVSALQTAAERRVRARPAAPVAVTGRLDADGAVCPVDEETLSTKVEAAFFSPVETLAVPRKQQGAAEEARDTLLSDFPHGRLDVVGLRRLRDVFDHRRLVERVETGRVRHLALKAWRRKGGIVSALLIAGLALALAWSLYGPLDKNPVQARFDGETMFVENEHGQVIEQMTVGEEIPHRIERGFMQPPVAFADVVGDERNEIFWGTGVDGQSHLQALRCKSVGADTLLWEKTLEFTIDFPRKPAVVSPTYRIQDLLAGDLDSNGRPKLYVTLNHLSYFPGLLLKLDAQKGTERQRYVHPGRFSSKLLSADLDGNGAQEILTGGYSNAYGDPIFAALDPRDLQGHGPTTSEYAVTGLDPASPHRYLRFPDTPVQEAAPGRLQMVHDIRVESDPQFVLVKVQDGFLDTDGKPPYVIVHLDFDLRPVAVGTSSLYDRLAERLVQAGRLDAVPDAEDFERYKEEIRYWTGDGWTTQPAVTP